MSQPHLSVLLDEVLHALAPVQGALIVDATFGAGGYSRALLDGGARVIGFDRDPGVMPHVEAVTAQAGERFRFIPRRFSELAEGLEDAGVSGVDGVVLDIGVSSMQLDEAERGFSFMRDGPLDMRMSQSGPSAADLVNEADEVELARIFYVYGEERQSRRIARRIVERRTDQPFESTLDLAAVVERALGGRKGAPTHPATRVFQALRIAVNEELSELEQGLDAAEAVLKPGGRLAVVTFHSLEDRIVKRFFTERGGLKPQGSRHAPPVAAGPEPTFRLLHKGAREPSEQEMAANPRARSARLRAGVRTEAPAMRAAA